LARIRDIVNASNVSALEILSRGIVAYKGFWGTSRKRESIAMIDFVFFLRLTYFIKSAIIHNNVF
jgi:hypothetical protein